MITERIDGASVNTRANVCFDGKCVSHGITLADGSRKSVGERFSVPANSSFEIRAAEAYHYVCHFG
jgi:hypothetical protein